MTIRDTINRQRENRESAERAKLERFAKAEAEAHALLIAKAAAEAREKAEAEARVLAQEQAKADAIAEKIARKKAEKLAKEQAKADLKAARIAEERERAEAKRLAKERAKAEAKALKQAKADEKERVRAEENARAKAEYAARTKAKLEAEALKQAIADEKERVRVEENARAKAEYEARTKARADAKAAEIAKALAQSQAREREKQEEKARVEAERQSLKLQKAQEAAAEIEKIEAEVQAQQLAKATAKMQAQQLAEAAADEQTKAQLEIKAIAAEAATILLQTKEAAKAQAKKQAHEMAVIKAQERAAARSKLKATTKEKSKSFSAFVAQLLMKLRSMARRLALYYIAGKFRPFARIAYGVAILTVVGLMAQVFMDRYPQTESGDVLYEIPVGDELAVIEADNHIAMSDEAEPQIETEFTDSLATEHVSELALDEQPSAEKNVTVTVTSSVAVSVAPKAKVKLDPDLKLANWQINAVESDIPAGYPRLVIVLDDLGMSVAVSQKIARLPAPLTLAFLPYANRLPYQSAMVAKQGHELLVHMPMAPKSKRVNPGNNALLDDLNKKEFVKRLNWNLSRFNGFIGINNHMGSSLTEHRKEMGWVMAELKDRGLVFLDSVTTSDSVAGDEALLAGVPTLSRNVFLDNDRDPKAILAQFKLAMEMSKRRGLAIAIGHPYPETLAVLKEWLPELDRQAIILTPLSAAMSEKYFAKTLLASKGVTTLVSAK